MQANCAIIWCRNISYAYEKVLENSERALPFLVEQNDQFSKVIKEMYALRWEIPNREFIVNSRIVHQNMSNLVP